MNAIGAAAVVSASPWVPVIAAAVGAGAALIVGVLTQLWTGHRENARWAREREERQEQWQRERTDRQEQWQREDSQRWLEVRQQAYARLAADLRDWEDKLGHARIIRKHNAEFGFQTEIDKSQIEQARRTAREDLALVVFMAPEQVAGQARRAVVLHESIEVIGLEPAPGSEHVDIAELDKLSEDAYRSRTSLEQVMRDDLGIGSLGEPPQDS